ncbi:hypothetical protein RI845_00955 [Thalassotalea nanhaiensis]|uniref:Uncharacterized protein n=1 Tax=Thalassotalea nanhaiensis TaxID=3065648 RepID=A0ABY9TIQ8_9GAMM|nr:hypothetical protein RI845_00955 [Colwelliaceae bacterium SQ345]
MKKSKINLKLILRRYSYFSTFVLVVAIGSFISHFTLEDFSWKVFIISISAVIGCASVTLLPVDIIKARKDRRMCERVNLDFDKFSMMKEVDKESIRKEYCE